MSTKITLDYLGDFKTKLIHGKTQKEIMTDLPEDNGGQEREFSPTDLMASSVAACIVTIMAKVAETSGFSIDGLSVDIEKVMNSNPRMIKQLIYSFQLPAGLDAAQKKRLYNSIKTCPAHRSLHKDVEVIINGF